MNKVLIIGSEGFIGSHCVDYFRNKKHTVYGVDLAHQPSSEYFYKKVFPQEVKHEELFRTIQPDICIYATGSANVNLSIQNPLSDFEANSVYIYHLLNSIRLFCPECKFINISSAAVYGNPTHLPVSENSLIAPISPYGWHKYYSELICKEFASLYKIKTCSIRPFSVYGPRQSKLLFWDIYQKEISKTEIELFGTGSETRDFIYVEDLVQAIDIIASKSILEAEVYNIGSGKQVSIKEASTLFLKIMNSQKKVIFNEVVKEGDPLNWQASIDLIKKIGFLPKVDLETGLNKYNKWLKGKE